MKEYTKQELDETIQSIIEFICEYDWNSKLPNSVFGPTKEDLMLLADMYELADESK